MSFVIWNIIYGWDLSGPDSNPIGFNKPNIFVTFEDVNDYCSN